MKQPKAMKEIHKIREKMSKLTTKELLQELKQTREEFKEEIKVNDAKSKKIEVKA